MRKILTVIGGNVVVLGFLIFLMNVLSIAAVQIYNWQKPKQYAQSHLFPNYKDDPAAARVHFFEYDNLTKGFYESFYAWRRPKFVSETINIDDDGLRRTHRPENASQNKKIAFFGGSTTWGTGADDLSTIPSFFAKQMTDYETFNYGETGYIAHQSLNLFMKRYFEGFRPDVVVFYDGVNDVWNKCRSELDHYSHSREHAMRVTLKEGGAVNPDSFLFTILPIQNLLGKVVRVLESRSRTEESLFDCHKNSEKADLVARVLVSDWMIVKSLVESYGGTFIGILQSHAFVSKTNLDHLKLRESLGWQYDAVYPRVLKLIESEFSDLQPNFADFRRVLDKEDYFYIDWCHLSPNGNKIVADRIAETVMQRTEKTAASQ